jgi:5-methylcytosine-specific restriction endonuclease McrA
VKRRTPLRASVAVDRSELGQAAWKAPRWGACEVCSRPGRLQRHHVVTERHVRQVRGGDPWDARNAMELCAACHADHHHGTRRLPLARVPDDALAFAVDLLGEHQAAAYLARHYAA